MGPMHLGSRMGTTHGIYPWVALVMGNLMRRHFWVSCDVFLGGGGGEEDSTGQVLQSRFALAAATL